MQEIGSVMVRGGQYAIFRQGSLGRTASARVRGRKIIINIPVSLPREEAFRLFLQMKEEIIRKTAAGEAGSASIEFKDGQRVEIMSRVFTIAVSESESAIHTSKALLEEGGNIRITLAKHVAGDAAARHITALARRVIAAAVLSEVDARARELNTMHYGFELEGVSISKANLTRWGSCSHNRKRINLDFRLLFAPDDIRDSVIVHELCHLKEANHSKSFWGLVCKACPNYKDARKWLNRNGHTLGIPKSGAGT